MVSRSDELTPAAHSEPPNLHDLKRHLLSLLPKEVRSDSAGTHHLAFGFDTPEAMLPPVSLDALSQSAESTPVILWRLPTDGSEGLSDATRQRLDAILQQWHDALPTASHLALAVPLSYSAQRHSHGERLPSRRQLTLRHVVRLLSEHGFAIRKETQLAAVDGADATDIAGWQLIYCRTDPFRVRAYGEGDETAILELFPTCFHTRRGRDHWQWKYRDNPFGDTAISLALSENKELGAHYAGYAMPFHYDLDGTPRTFPALQMGDTMTNPVFRNAGRGRSGLLARTVRHFFSLHRGGPYGFFYGFNTGPIQRFCRWFIGGSKVEPVGFWRYEPTATTTQPSWAAPGYHVERLTHGTPKLDKLFRQAAPHYGFLVRRDAEYVRWRYLACPDTDYTVLAVRRWRRLVGWGVFRRQEDRLIWGDAFFHPRHRRSVGPMLTAASELLADGGEPLAIEAWFSERPEWWAAHLSELGFTRRPHPQGLGFMALPDGEPGATEHLPELYYSMGDGDLF